MKTLFSSNTGTVSQQKSLTFVPKLIEQQNVHENKENISPVNIYIGENFSVRIKDWFKFNKFLQDNKTGGIVHCDFTPNKGLTSMNLSNGGARLRDVPNAGGSSVISEVLSFEVLQKCFKANLIKVCIQYQIYFNRH